MVIGFSLCSAIGLSKDNGVPEPSETSIEYERLNYLALKEMTEGNWLPAFKSLSQAMNLDPDRPDVYLNYARAHFQRKEYAAAERAVQKTLEIDPDLAGAWNLHARLMVMKDDPAAAIESAEKAVACGGGLRWQSLVLLGGLYADTEDWLRAKHAFDEAIEVLRDHIARVDSTINQYANNKWLEMTPQTETAYIYNRVTRTMEITTRENHRSYVSVSPAPEGWSRELEALKEMLDEVKKRKSEVMALSKTASILSTTSSGSNAFRSGHL